MASIQYEMRADESGDLLDAVDENCLRDMIASGLGMDARYVADCENLRTVGMHTVKVMTVKRVLVQETVTVWIVPLEE
jgi:ribosomal protein L9